MPVHQRSSPPVDEHLVELEVTRDEIIGGRRVIAMPTKEPHATLQFQLDYVLEPHIASGYVGAAVTLNACEAAPYAYRKSRTPPGAP